MTRHITDTLAKLPEGKFTSADVPGVCPQKLAAMAKSGYLDRVGQKEIVFGKFWEKYPATEYQLTEHGKQRRAKGLCQKK